MSYPPISEENKAWNDMVEAMRAWSSAYKYGDPPPRMTLLHTIDMHRRRIDAARRADARHALAKSAVTP
jgi:hypothetical protein